MSEAEADSTEEATGELTGNPVTSDSTPTGQEQGDQARINGLMALANKRLSERDQAQAEVEALKALLADYETQARAEESGPSQIELMYGTDEATGEPGPNGPDSDSTPDPMAPPEPPVIVASVWPSRGQSTPLGDAPPMVGDASSPSFRYARDQADLAAMKAQLNVLGNQWVQEAKANGLMQD